MWSRFYPVFLETKRLITIWAFLAFLSPTVPFAIWILTPKAVEEELTPLITKKEKAPLPKSEWFPLKEKEKGEYLAILENEVHFCGINTRPDREQEEILLALKGGQQPVKMGAPFFIGMKEGKWAIVDEKEKIFTGKIVEGSLFVDWMGEERKFALPKKNSSPDSHEWRLMKERVSRFKYLGVDRVKEFLQKPQALQQVRLFDESEQKMFVFKEMDLFYMKEGRLQFVSKEKEAKQSCLCRLEAVREGSVEVSLWDKGGFFVEKWSMPLYKGEKLGAEAQKVFQGAKRFGHQVLWLQKSLKQAVYVGDWLFHEKGQFIRLSPERLEAALEGRLKGGLLYFKALQKIDGKWVAEIVVFDSLHIQKELLQIPLESKSNTAPSFKPPQPSTKHEAVPQKKRARGPRLPGMIEPLLDEMDDEQGLDE